MARLETAALVLLMLASSCARVPPPMPEALSATRTCEERTSAGDLAGAESFCTRATQVSPQFADAWTAKGLLLLKKNWLKDAQAAFLKAVTLNDRDARAQNGLGIIAFLGKHYDYADGQFRRAVDLKPGYIAARYNLAQNYFVDHASRRAKETMAELLKRDPKQADAHFFLAAFYLGDGAGEDALDHIKKALALDPKQTAYWLALGDIYNFLHRYDDADYALHACLEIDRRDANCTENLERLRARDELIPPQLGPPRP